MKLWLRATFLSGAAAIVLAFCLLARRPADPVVSGRPASAWVADLLSPEYQTRDAAQTVLVKLGEQAVPQIRLLLQTKTRPWEPHLARFARVFPFLNQKSADPAFCRARAAEMITILGPIGRAAVPDLIDSLAYPEAAENAERALIRVGDDSMSGVISGLRDYNPLLRIPCARILRSLSHAPQSVAPLIEATLAPEKELRKEAVLTLGEFSIQDARILPALLKVTNDERFEVRAAVCQSLGKLHAITALPDLKAAMHDPVPLVRLDSAKSVWELTHDAALVLPVLIDLLPTSEGWQAAYALGNMGPIASPAVPALIEALKREKVPRAFRTPPSSSFALGQIREPAIPALEKVLDHPEAAVRLAAVLAFSIMGRSAHDAVPKLQSLLHDPDSEVRHVTAITLASIGAERQIVLTSLADCLNAEDIYMRSAAAALLREIAPEQQWVVAPE